MAKRLQRSTSRPTAAAPASPSAGTAEAPRKRGGRVSGTAVTEFTIQLATLTEAGIPIVAGAIDHAARGIDTPKDYAAFVARCQ